MKAAFYTLGCKVNQYDTQMMSEKLIQAGYDICSFDDIADIYIINTCTVTQISDKKSRNIISRARRLNPQSIIIVCGCFSQVSPDEVAKIEGVNIVLGTKNRVDIVEYINKFKNNKKQIIDATNEGTLEKEIITSFSEKTRAILKIEDGCRNFCSYCLIPFARGKITSKPIKQVINEATQTAKNGYKEIVLTGIHLSSYGKDLDNVDLADAINAVNEIEQYYHCFGCGASGNVIKFVEKYESLDFYDACKKLAEYSNMELPSYQSDENFIKLKKKRERIYDSLCKKR